MSTNEEYKNLEAERDALAARVAEMREALTYYANFGDDGVPVEDVAKAALATPDDSAAILARRDAAIKEQVMLELLEQMVEALNDKYISIKRGGK